MKARDWLLPILFALSLAGMALIIGARPTPTTTTMKKPLDQIERRVTHGRVEQRAGSNGKPMIRGYAAVFNSRSENLGGFVEVIAPGAFDGVLGDDVRALFNHDANLILGRTKSGTLRLHADSFGLAYEIDPPDTQTARDLMESLRRGDVDQSSFAFAVRHEDQDWKNLGAGLMLRTIKRVARLYDVSPVTHPAYADTSVAARELQRALGHSHGGVDTPDAECRERELRLACAEMGVTYDPRMSAEAFARELQLKDAEQ